MEIIGFAWQELRPLLEVSDAVIDNGIAVHIKIMDSVVLFEIGERFKNLHMVANYVGKIRRNAHCVNILDPKFVNHFKIYICAIKCGNRI